MDPTDRQKREIEYHKHHANVVFKKNVENPVDTDILSSDNRKWWNHYWNFYTKLLDHDFSGKRILVPGCGFCKDAILLSLMGAEVYGFDISPDVIEGAKKRIENFGYTGLHLSVQPSENTDYPDDFFDYVIFVDILHHVDIPATLKETVRILKPGGTIIGNELYSHSFLEKKVRNSWFVRNILYKLLRDFVYRDKIIYITPDEHKIDETEFSYISDVCTEFDQEYFYILSTRLFPDSIVWATKLDRFLCKGLMGASKYLAARVAFEGTIKK